MQVSSGLDGKSDRLIDVHRIVKDRRLKEGNRQTMHQGAAFHRKRMSRRYLSMATLLGLLLALSVPAVTQAHPLGNFTVNQYSRLEIAPGQLRIFYVLDMAEIPTFQLMQQIDGGDGQVSASEGNGFATTKVDELVRGIRLTLDGKPIELTPVLPTLSFPPGQAGLSLLRLTFWLEGTPPDPDLDTHTGEYEDTNNADRVGWKEIVVQGQDGVRVFDSTVSDRDRSDELRVYPVDMLSSPLQQSSARFAFQTNAGQVRTLPSQSGPALGSATNDGAFAALITLPDLNLSVIFLALLTAVGLGALHALEPGHGKTMAAAYLVGARATARHAFALGLTITGMHTSSVFVLGFVTLFASRLILPERLLPWLGLVSGLIVIILGLRMFLSRLPQFQGPTQTDHDHDHMGAHDHSHGNGHTHSHQLPTMLTEKRVGWRGVLAIGISGGLVPCPAALIVLISAIGLGRMGFGMLLIVAFSAGLALVLSMVGLTVIYGRRWFTSNRAGKHIVSVAPALARFARFLPALSGLLVVAAGFLLLYHALPLLRAL